VHILNTLRESNWVIEGQRGAAVRLGVKLRRCAIA